jgi:RimJ/RimL family protein N-acetyltransferase
MEVVLLNPSNSEHMAFMFDLATACKEDFLDDFNQDEILLLHQYADCIKSGQTTAFIAKADGKNAGIIWVDVTPTKIGYLHVGLLPEFRKGFNALGLIRDFMTFCFNTLELRKLEASIPTKNITIEKLLRRLGFTKEGVQMEATVVNGESENHVLLAMTKKRYQEDNNGIQK